MQNIQIAIEKGYDKNKKTWIIISNYHFFSYIPIFIKRISKFNQNPKLL